MGNFGFSYIGFIFLLMLTIPNIIWIKNQPQNYDPSGENKLLVILERIGQILVTSSALIFMDYNPKHVTIWELWLVAAFSFMVLYECWWMRYFKSKRELADFYSSYFGFPVAGATLPVVAFFLLGIYGKVIWLMISVIILGIGHIGIHLQHQKNIKMSVKGQQQK